MTLNLNNPVAYYALGAFAFLVWRLANWQSRQERIRRLGKPPVMVPGRLPFGIDTAYTMVSHLMRHQFFEKARELLDNPGRTCEMQLAGSRLVMTDDCENIKAIMYGQFGQYRKGELTHKIFHTVLGDSVFSTDGEAWHANKNQLRPYLSKSRPSDFDVTESHVRIFLDKLENSQGQPSEVYDLVDRLQLDIVTHVFFGESTDSLLGLQQPFRDAMDELLKFNTFRILLGPIALLFPDTLFARRATRDLNSYMDTQVDKTLALSAAGDLDKRSGSLTLMEALALERPDREFIKNQLISVLLAGKDPVGICISWALYELARNPDAVKRLRDEIETICGFNSLPTADHLKQMTFLKCVIRETLRLYHPLGFNIREAKLDTSIPRGGGPDGSSPVTILKGEQVAYSVLTLQRRHDLWGETADEWLPSRFYDPSTPGGLKQPETWEFIPFNHGPRICLGRVFGYFQMEYVLCRIFQTFGRVELSMADEHHSREKEAGGEKMRIKVELNTKMAGGVYCRFFSAGGME